ncbi:hypothetical protein [Flavobacterium sp.]
MALSKKLKSDWQALMTGMMTIARKWDNFHLVHVKENAIFIDVDWKIECHFINFKYVEVIVEYQGETYLTVRHMNSYAVTSGTVLEFIDNNKK